MTLVVKVVALLAVAAVRFANVAALLAVAAVVTLLQSGAAHVLQSSAAAPSLLEAREVVRGRLLRHQRSTVLVLPKNDRLVTARVLLKSDCPMIVRILLQSDLTIVLVLPLLPVVQLLRRTVDPARLLLRTVSRARFLLKTVSHAHHQSRNIVRDLVVLLLASVMALQETVTMEAPRNVEAVRPLILLLVVKAGLLVDTAVVRLLLTGAVNRNLPMVPAAAALLLKR